MRNRLFMALVGLVFCTQVFAQKEETILGSRGLGLTGGWGGWTSAITKFGDDYSLMTGGFGGAEFGKMLLVGGGGYSIVSDVKFDQLTPQKFSMSYGGLLLGAGFSNWRAVHPTFSVMGGGGSIALAGEGNDHIFVVQPQLGIELNVTRWFHLGLEGGYRFVTDTGLPSLSDSQLSAPFAEVRLKFGWSWGRGRHHSRSKTEVKK